VDKIEKFVNGGSSGEVPNVDSAAGSSVGGTESNLEGSRRILCLLFDRESDDKTMKSCVQCKGVLTWKLFIWLLYGNPPMVPKTFIPGRPIPSML